MTSELFNYEQPGEPVAAAAGDVILRGLDAAQWQTFVGFAEQLAFAPGQPILRAGEVGRAIYIIKSGHVAAALPGASKGQKEHTPVQMGPGAVFGEIAFFDGTPRSASVWAQDEVELLVLPFAAFEKLAAWHPRIARELLLDLGRVLAMRLRRAEAQGAV